MSDKTKEVPFNEQIKTMPKFLFAYVGMTLDNKGKRTYNWTDVTDLDNNGQKASGRSFTLKPRKGGHNSVPGAHPGQIFSFPHKEGSDSFYTGYAKYVALWKNEEQRTIWHANDKATKTTLNAKAAQRKNKGDERLQEALLRLNLAYNQSNPAHSTGLLAYFIKEITKYNPR